MELKVYFQILLKKWWIVLSVFLITLTAGIFLTYTTTPIYQARATYVVVPNASLGTSGRDVASGLDLIGRREEIAATFSQIAASRTIRNLALEKLSLSAVNGYEINSRVVAGTSIMVFEVEGPDPVITQNLANAVAKAAEEYVKSLYEVFTLLPLDEATLPRVPISPNVTMNLALSAFFGLILGLGLAFLAQYLETPFTSATVASVNIIDQDTGVYNKPYFLQRLTSEMARTKRNRYPLSLALMRIDNLDLIKGADSGKVRTEILHQMGVLTSQYLREEDIVAYLENDTFAFLLLDTTGENAKAIMEYLQSRVAWSPFESSISGLKFNPKGVIGITDYDYNGVSRNEFIARAMQALQLAESDGQAKAYLVSDESTMVDEPHVQAEPVA